jgi:hypothetical protein
MTVANNTSRNQYKPSLGQTVFAYTFEIVNKNDIVVLKNGTALSEGTDYTVSNVGNDSGGNVTLTVGTGVGDTITLYRDMPYARTQNYTNAGDFLASDVNNDFDNLWLATEQISRGFTQSLRKPITDSDSVNMELPNATARADKVLAFDSQGNISLANRLTTAIDVQTGTWTPFITDSREGTQEPGYLLDQAQYVKVENLVSLTFEIAQLNTTSMTPASTIYVNNLPFVPGTFSGDTTPRFYGSAMLEYFNLPASGQWTPLVEKIPSLAFGNIRFVAPRSSTQTSLTWSEINIPGAARINAQINYFTNE